MTAIEWLEFRYKNNINLHQGDFEQAKEIEKQQIIDACYYGSQDLPYEIKEKSEEYYNETFKNK